MARDIADTLFGPDPEKNNQPKAQDGKAQEGKAFDQKTLDAVEAMKGMIDGMKTIMQGLADIAYSPEMKDVVKHGAAELGAFMHTGNAYVMYPKESRDKQPDHGLGNLGQEQQQERGKGRSL
jgi:hypothetical protein